VSKGVCHQCNPFGGVVEISIGSWRGWWELGLCGRSGIGLVDGRCGGFAPAMNNKNPQAPISKRNSKDQKIAHWKYPNSF